MSNNVINLTSEICIRLNRLLYVVIISGEPWKLVLNVCNYKKYFFVDHLVIFIRNIKYICNLCVRKISRTGILPSSLSTSFWSFCTERSANSARASACNIQVTLLVFVIWRNSLFFVQLQSTTYILLFFLFKTNFDL